MALVDALIPTYGRKTGLAVALTSLLGQTFQDFDVTVSDQTEEEMVYLGSIEIQTLARALEFRWLLENKQLVFNQTRLNDEGESFHERDGIEGQGGPGDWRGQRAG